MLLENKVAIVYGAGGAIGSAVARAFAREGAKVFLTGDKIAPIEALAKEIAAAGGAAEAARVDALDAEAVERHAGEVARKAGGIDVSFNVVAIPHIHGTALVDLPPEDFALPISNYARTHFLTATAAARRMIKKESGVILMMTAPPGRMPSTLVGAFGAACAAIEAFSRTLAAEVGPKGVRVACLRSSGSPEAPGVHEVFGLHAKADGMTSEEFQAQLEKQSLLRRLTTLVEVTNVAVFIASGRASALTGTTINLTCGSAVD